MLLSRRPVETRMLKNSGAKVAKCFSPLTIKSMTRPSNPLQCGNLSPTRACSSISHGVIITTLYRLVVVGFLALYIVLIVAINTQLRENRLYIAYICVLNMTALLLLGKYMIRSILFPYSNYFIRTQLDSVINQRFS